MPGAGSGLGGGRLHKPSEPESWSFASEPGLAASSTNHAGRVRQDVLWVSILYANCGGAVRALQRGLGAAGPRLLWTLGAEATRPGGRGGRGRGGHGKETPHAGFAFRIPEPQQWDPHWAPESARSRAHATSASGCGNLLELRGFD